MRYGVPKVLSITNGRPVLVRNLCDSLDIRNIGVRVAESLDVNRLSIVLDSAFQFFQMVCINEGGLNAELRQEYVPAG